MFYIGFFCFFLFVIYRNVTLIQKCAVKFVCQQHHVQHHHQHVLLIFHHHHQPDHNHNQLHAMIAPQSVFQPINATTVPFHVVAHMHHAPRYVPKIPFNNWTQLINKITMKTKKKEVTISRAFKIFWILF